MDFSFFGQILALVLVSMAAYFDIKTGTIPDLLNYFFIAAGVIISLATFNIAAFAIAIATFAFGYLLYQGGKIGGGDVKMFVAIALLVPLKDGRVFVVDLLLVAAATALIVLSAYYLAKYAKKGIKIEDNKKNLPYAVAMLGFSAVYLYAFYAIVGSSLFFLLIMGIMLFFATAFIALERGIRKEFFLAKVKISELEEDETFAYDFIDEKTRKIIAGKNILMKGILGSSEIARLKKAGIRHILVYRNLPKFAPFVLFAMLLLIFFPDVIGSILWW